MKAGCYIDGSHISNLDFTIAVIDFAVSLGFEIDEQAYRNDLENLTVADDVERVDILDSLDWTMQEALDYINWEFAPEGMMFLIHESSLYLEEVDA